MYVSHALFREIRSFRQDRMLIEMYTQVAHTRSKAAGTVQNTF